MGLYKKGLLDAEIAKQCCVHTTVINVWRWKNKLPANGGQGWGGYRPGSGRKKVAY